MKEQFEKALNKIGWKITGRYPNQRIVDHNNLLKDIRVMGDRLEISGELFDCCFHYKDVEIYELDTNGKIDCVGLKAKGNDNVFIQFYNH